MKFQSEKTKAVVRGVYVSIHPDRSYQGDDYAVTKAVDELILTTEGVVGDRHFGYESISGGRQTNLYARGTRFRNNRQWSAISTTEVERIAQNLGIEGKLTPELLGVNLLIDGIENLTQLPPMTYLSISPEAGDFVSGRPDDVTLVVYAQALPCRYAGKALVDPCGNPALESAFPKDALGLRGATGWVERGGIIRSGYTVWAMTSTGRD